jgi:hypothetical protein
VYGLLGPRTQFSGHRIEQGYELKMAGMIAAAGLRVCIDELSSVEVPKLKSGKDGKPRVVYADVADAERWMWRFLVCRVAGYAERVRAVGLVGCSARGALLSGSA